MSDTPARVRYVGEVAVVAFGADAVGELLPAGGLAGLLDADGRKVVLDRTGAPPITSAFLGKLLVLAHRARLRRGGLRLCGLSKSDRELLVMTRLDALVPILPTADDALRDF